MFAGSNNLEMQFSTRGWVLGSIVTLIVSGAAVGLLEHRARVQHREHVAAILDLQEQLDLAWRRVEAWHAAMARKGRMAFFYQDNPSLTFLQQPANDLEELNQHLAALRQVIMNVRLPKASQKLDADLQELTAEWDHVGELAIAVKHSWDALFQVISDNDLDMLLETERQFNLDEEAMRAELIRAVRLMRSMVAEQMSFARHTSYGAGIWIWLVFGGVALLAWLVALRAISLFIQAPSGLPRGWAPSDARALAQTMQNLRGELQSVENEVALRQRELERLTFSARRAEHEVALLRIYNENLVNSLRSAILVTDTAGVLQSFNRVARTTLGFDTSHTGMPLASHPVFEAITRRQSGTAAELEKALTDKQVLRFEGVPFSGPQGEVLLDVVVAPYLDEGGAVRGFLWVADDVTDAIRAKRQLLSAERLAVAGTLAAQVAHEIRNPLSAIALNAELLEDEFSAGLSGAQKTEAISLLQAIGTEIERLTQLTEGYLQLTRLPQPNRSEVDLNQVVGDLLAMLDEELRMHGIQTTVDLAAPAPRALADPGQLRQAILNIVRNSQEAMPQGGQLRIQTQDLEHASLVIIEDSGPGIEPELLHRIFEPFFTTKKQGTGLGLSLTKQIMDEHQGKIKVSSKPSQGTRISMSLPKP